MAEPVGEDSWLSMVDEASRVAGDLEQRIEVVERYKEAVSAEPYSLRLWLAYCEWIWSLHVDCQTGDAGWSEEEQLLGQELFSWDMARDMWQQGAQATCYRMNDSHLLWNRWISIELDQLSKQPEKPSIQLVQNLFEERLQIPQAVWNETSQMFSTFITKYDEPAWETTMVRVTELAKQAKTLYSWREVRELNLQKAVNSGDKDTIKASITDYLAWETAQISRKKRGSWTLLFALYERALLLIGTNVATWEDYAEVSSKAKRELTKSADISSVPYVLSILQRATRHCPWSGSLWSRYMLRAEAEGLSFSEVEQIKHSATGCGQLDRDGLADVLAVYSTWCGFLRRRAVSPDASDEDVDIADVGLSSALESFQEWGERLYGKNAYQGDPTFRLEQCLIRYVTETGAISDARSQWRKLVRTHGNSYEFWQRYYLWEMTIDPPGSPRPIATEVLRQAVNTVGVDWPEKMMEMYLQHCESYEGAESLTEAIDLVHAKSKAVIKRRQLEAAKLAATYPQEIQQPEPAVNDSASELSPSGTSKRKRESVTDIDGGITKKVKGNDENQNSQHLKRDRENTTVIVTNLPVDVTQTKIRLYFKEYGHINNLSVTRENDEQSTTALIEFRSPEDVQSALLKDEKYFSDKQIHVKPGTGLTLYVTNYPPTADEVSIRKLFTDCGEILSIRWPSLRYNVRRRFCYISFKTADAATAATQLDGKLLEGRYKLEVKYSDPGKKKLREGAGAEGREIHVSNIDRVATEDDLREVFSKYGKVENVRILRNMGGLSKGGGFVVFETKKEASDALALDKTKFRSQILNVELSTQANYKPISTIVGGKASSASPAPDTEGDMRMSNSPAPNSEGTGAHPDHHPSRSEIAARTIAIMNVPDTVNDSRIRALAETYGEIIKLTLRPDHQGAIIEFADTITAGRASLGLENHEIIPGRKLRIGAVKELFHEKSEYRTDRIQPSTRPKKAKPAVTGFMPPAAPVRRPGGGGRGGLGIKRGLGFSALAAGKKEGGLEPANAKARDESENLVQQPKSNADFKVLFLNGEGQ